MEKILAFFQHRRLQQTLVLYADGELSPNAMTPMRRHLESCEACRQKLADIHACRDFLQAGKATPFIPTEQLWQRLTRKISASPRFVVEEIFSFRSWRHWRWTFVAAGLLLFALTIWNQTSRNSGVIDYGIFLDDMHQETTTANFYKRYPAQVVKLVEARQAITFPLAAIETLPEAFRLDCVRVLECNGKKCIQFTCVKDDKVINIFQHAPGQPWTLGDYAVARTPICNVECAVVNMKNLRAVNWRGKASEYLAVGNLAPEEFEQVVKVLQ